MKKLISFFLLSVLAVPCLARPAASSDPILSEISEEEAYVWAAAIESTAPEASFAVRVALACVLLNRYRSPLFPSSPLKIAATADFLSLDCTVEPSHKSLSAVRFALLGASPCGRALYVKRGEGERGATPLLEIEGWCFYSG